MDQTTIINRQTEVNIATNNLIDTEEKTQSVIQSMSHKNTNITNVNTENEQAFENNLQDNSVISQEDIDHLTAKLKELETQITKEHDTLKNSETFKNMITGANRLWRDNGKRLVKNENTLTTIRCNELLSNTKEAIKRSLSQLSVTNSDNKQFVNAQRVLLEGYNIQPGVKVALDKITIAENINELCGNLLCHSLPGNSTYFKNVIKAIKNFQKLPAGAKTTEAIDALYAALNTYITIRSKSGKKTRFKSPVGAKRIKYAKELKAALEAKYYINIDDYTPTLQESGKIIETLSMDKIQENINSRVDQMVSIQHPDIFKDEALAKERYNDICHLIITKKMLEPDFVKSHKENFQNYIAIIKKTKDYLTDDKETYKTFSNAYTKYRDHAQLLHNNYKYLENYVRLCNDNTATEDALSKARKQIKSWKHNPEYLSTAIAYYDYYMEQSKCYEIIQADIDWIKANLNVKTTIHPQADVSRFAGIVKPWKINKNGLPASDRDMTIYKENLRLFSSMYFGDDKEFYVAVKEKFEQLFTECALEENDMIDSSWKDNWQIKVKSFLWLNIQNILIAHNNDMDEAAYDFAQMFPELTDKISDYSVVAESVYTASNVFFNDEIGRLEAGVGYNNLDDTTELDEEDELDPGTEQRVKEYLTKAKKDYKKLKIKYGDIL